LLALVAMLTLLAGVALAQSPCLTGGNLDPTFDIDGKVTTNFGSNDAAAAVVLQPDGKIIAAGSTGNSDRNFALARYNPDGTLDPTFDGDGTVTTVFGPGTDAAVAVVLQPDGKIIAAGYTTIGGIFDFALARYNPDGALDSTFGVDGKVTTNFGGQDGALAVVLQPDGKIIAAGFGGTDDFALARYNPDGTLDTTFDTDGKVTTDFGPADSAPSALVLQPDGKIIAAGEARISGAFDFALARYNHDGSLDLTFDTDGKVTTNFGSGHDRGSDALLQPGGKIVVSGFAAVGSTFAFGLARYNSDGSLDPTFDTDGKVTTTFGSSESSAAAIVLQPDGRIVAAGNAVRSTGTIRDFALARYNEDGALDTTFDGDGKVTTIVGTSESGAAGVARQPDGKIVAAGNAVISGTQDFALVRYGTCPPPALQLTTAVSRQTHGGAGAFDIDMPLTGATGVECRSSGGNHTLVVSFTNNVVSGNASVTTGTGTVSGSPSFAGNTMTVNLTGVANAQDVTLTLSNVTDSLAQVLPDMVVGIGFLVGDTNGDRSVNSGDTLQTRNRSGQTAAAANFRSDVNVDGVVNSGDTVSVRARSGTFLP
jgi:uncharacterized delta-60 repeat protein